MFPIILSCIVVSLIIGKTAGLFLATHIYSTQNKTVILLNSIRKIVRSWEDGLFEGKEREIFLYILCETDLSNPAGSSFWDILFKTDLEKMGSILVNRFKVAKGKVEK